MKEVWRCTIEKLEDGVVTEGRTLCGRTAAEAAVRTAARQSVKSALAYEALETLLYHLAERYNCGEAFEYEMESARLAFQLIDSMQVIDPTCYTGVGRPDEAAKRYELLKREWEGVLFPADEHNESKRSEQ